MKARDGYVLAQMRTALRRRTLLKVSLGAATAIVAPSLLAQTAGPPRIVSVSGSMTEIVYALGAEAQLVGTDTTSLFPDAAQRTAKVGYMRQLSAEGLLSLKPDVVVGTTEAGPGVVMDQLRSTGVRVDLVEADHTWGEVQRKIALVGRAVARDAQAAVLQARLDSRWADMQGTVNQKTGRRPRAIFILSHSASPQVAGERTAAHAMLKFAGLENAMASGGTTGRFSGYRPMTAEALATAAPDLIVTTTQGLQAIGGAEKFWARPGLELTSAHARRALVALDALYLIGFGPRLPQAVQELHAAAQRFAA